MGDRFDALVIGGGPAGATCAILLAQAGWSVALLERQRFPRSKVCGEYVSLTNWPLLERLGLSAAFREAAGPEVRRVGLLAGRVRLSSRLPRTGSLGSGWGRALARERLDALVLEKARAEGVEVRQPWSASGWTRRGDGYSLRVESHEGGEAGELSSPVLIAAHGSWEPGPLPTQRPRPAPRPEDLLAFKARFRGVDLPSETMPLLCFPGGYGGLVQADGGRWSLSACIRRDRLKDLRRPAGESAGEAVLEHILLGCPALGPVLRGAEREGPWLSAGPIRPGVRPRYLEGAFLIGNAAGEAHPVVAEGITMAMQSAWLLAGALVARPEDARREAGRLGIARRYARLWRRSFAPRMIAASLFAHWAMTPPGVRAALPLLRRFPRLLTWGALLGGKARQVIGEGGGRR